MLMNASNFLDSFVKDEIDCRCLSEETFGQPLDNADNDVPLYDMYNRGLSACEEGLERTNLALEGMKRPGRTGYIPSVEDAHMYPGTLPMPSSRVGLNLPSADITTEALMSQQRQGLVK
jgi:hypothetical protein